MKNNFINLLVLEKQNKFVYVNWIINFNKLPNKIIKIFV